MREQTRSGHLNFMQDRGGPPTFLIGRQYILSPMIFTQNNNIKKCRPIGE